MAAISTNIKIGIFLIGCMGSGKTETGKALHRLTGLPLLDMDEVICREQGRSIPDLFEQMGEQAFRQIESDLLKRLCSPINDERHPIRFTAGCRNTQELQTENDGNLLQNSSVSFLVACGGGVAELSENVEILRTRGQTFFLQGSPSLLFSRVKNDRNRPNVRADVADEVQRFQHFCELCQRRESGYRKAASHIISIEGKTPMTIAREILTHLSDSCH